MGFVRSAPLLALVCCIATASAGLAQGDSGTSDALAWLARHQNGDGSWGPHACGTPHAENPPGDPEHTAYGLLGFLGASYTHRSKAEGVDPVTGRPFDCGAVVKNGLRWLIQHQTADGAFAVPGSPARPGSHAVATLALVDAFGRSASAILKEPAQLAVNHLLREPDPGANPVTLAWTVLAAHGADLAGLGLPPETLERLRAQVRQLPGEGLLDCAVRLACGLELGLPRSWVDPDARRLAIAEPSDDDLLTIFSVQGLYAFDGPGTRGDGACWTAWSERLLLPQRIGQEGRTGGCAWGSWPGADRMRRTALLALAFETIEGRFPPERRVWPK